MRRWLVVAVLVLFSPIPEAKAQVLEFSSEATEHRFRSLAKELRCLVCQNQSLADSQAGLADDLRREVLSMIEKGDSDAQIIQFLVDRYGEFVLYRPRMTSTTYALWYAPAGLLAIGLLGLVVLIRRRSRSVADQPSSAELERVRRLLDQDSTDT